MHRRKNSIALLGAVVLLGAGCGSTSGDSAAGERRTVQLDYKHDEFATSLFDYFPRQVEVRQGDTVEFKQAWAGEPHSVTMGTLIDEKIEPVLKLLLDIERTGDIPSDEPSEFREFFSAVPSAFGGDNLAQNAAQPCYVDATEFDGKYPGDQTTPCPVRTQPPFTGRQAIYNSGIIPYEGVQGNTFRIKVADDAKPGTYSYFCNVHGPLQWGQVVVKDKSASIPSAGEVARQARQEVKKKIAPMQRNWRAAKEGKPVTGGDPGQELLLETKGKNLVGVPVPFFEKNTFTHGVVNEFVPRDLTTRVGQKTTWTFIRGHTLSFNVPTYFPVFTVGPDGTVLFNKKAEEPQGWPAPPEDRGPPEGGGGHADDAAHAGGSNAGEKKEGPPPAPKPVHIDAGEWDGRGFRSTGLNFDNEDTFSVAFTKPGTYAFACLVHPQMVGKLVVKS